ncbi:MAG: hypothetical protein H6746_18530 [Deltaproteobacteria bacterium]|nr:hypothetical protein [Deltaproteobacteria bacterium]
MSRWLLALLLALASGACGGASTEASLGAGEGESCAPQLPCAGDLLCVDGLCRVRAPGPDARATPDSPPPLPDGLWDDLPDVAAPDQDVDEPLDAADADAAETIGPPEDAVDAEVDDTDAGPTGDAIVLVFSEDEAGMNPADTSLTLDDGQGWVTELTVPFSGQIVGMQALLVNAFGPDSCARFWPAVWLPQPDGAFADTPTWQSPQSIALVGGPKPIVFFLAESVPSSAGRIRIGLIREGICEIGAPTMPVLRSDDSGDLSRTWLWVPDAAGSPWIDGEDLGIEGRWGLAVLIEVVL